jgi:uncharacterized membrane protein
MLALRYLYVAALVVWLGGMVVLGVIVAPTLFEVLQATDPQSGRALAAAAFGSTIARFHYVAYAAGALLLVTLAAMRILGPKPAAFAIRALIVLVMLGIAIYSGVVVLGRIDAIQMAAGMLPSRLPAADPRRLEFDALHTLASQLMGANVVGAMILLYWEAKEHS